MDRTALRRWLPLLIALVVFGLVWRSLRVPASSAGLHVTLEVNTSCADTFHLYWDDNAGFYGNDRRVAAAVAPDRGTQRITFVLPDTVRHVQGIRIDPGTQAVRMDLVAMELQGPYRTLRLDAARIMEWFGAVYDLQAFEVDTVRHHIPLTCKGNDPYFASTHNIVPLTAEALDPLRPVVRPFLLAVLAAIMAAVLVRLLTRRIKPRLPLTSVAALRPGWPNILIASLVSVLAFLLVRGIANNINFEDRSLVVELEVTAVQEDNFQVFYAKKPGGFSQGYYVNCPVQAARGRQMLEFRMPADTLFRFLRFDPGNKQDSLRIHGMTLRCNDEAKHYDAEALTGLFKANEQVSTYALERGDVVIRFRGNDPYLFSDKDIGEEVRALWEGSGNGPLPGWGGLLAAVAVFAGLLGNARLEALRTSARPVEIATGLVFCTLISLPMLSDLLPVEPFIPDTEKRPLADKPLLRMHSITDFPDKYTRYWSDHFGFRKSLFRANSLFHHYVLHCSSMPDNVIYGKDGYLFLMKPGVERFYRHRPVFTEAEMQRIAERLDHRKKWLAERGIEYYLVVPPLKATMYPEKLPDRFRKVDDRSELDDLKDYLDKHCSVKLIDMRTELREAKHVRDIYYTTDIHWNPWGGFIGYRVLMREMLKDHPELGLACNANDYIVQADTNDNGDLALQLALNDKLTRVTYMMAPTSPFRAKPLPEEALPASAFFKYKPVFYQGPDPQAPKMLMFRDSFAVYLMPYLNEHFSRSVYVWTPILIPDIIEKEKPDIVVQEIMELFLPDLLEDKLTDPL